MHSIGMKDVVSNLLGKQGDKKEDDGRWQFPSSSV